MVMSCPAVIVVAAEVTLTDVSPEMRTAPASVHVPPASEHAPEVETSGRKAPLPL